MDESKERQLAWINSNPLRKWRTTNKKTLSEVAPSLKLGYHRVHEIETGKGLPSKYQFQLLTALIHIDAKAAWSRWLKKRPT